MSANGYVRSGSPSEPKRRRVVFLLTVFVTLLAIGASASSALALSPGVATQPAGSVAETSATLNGLVNPNGLETKIYFEYGTTTSYGSKTSEVSVGSGSSTLEKSEALISLTKDTTYHYRIVASNADGTSYGVDQTFTTVGPPYVSFTFAETNPSGEEATLKAFIDPNGQATTYQFEYGTSSGSYTVKAPASPASAGSGYTVVPVSTTITGLKPGTKYFYRVVATNASGSFNSSEVSFLSNKAPGTEILPASGIWRSQATLGAKIEPHTLKTTYYFEYFTWGFPAVKTATKEISGEVASATVTEPLSGLKENTEYIYRVVASNSAGTISSSQWYLLTLGPITLNSLGGPELIKAASLNAKSANLTIGGRACPETELAGELQEQSGARQRVTALNTPEFPIGCTWKPENSQTVKYRLATQKEAHALEYAKNKFGEVVLRSSPEFRVIGDIYQGFSK